jgi:hypothetical protein
MSKGCMIVVPSKVLRMNVKSEAIRVSKAHSNHFINNACHLADMLKHSRCQEMKFNRETFISGHRMTTDNGGKVHG